MWRAAISLLLCSGCASAAPRPVFNDLQYLRFGVDPYAEASSLIETYAAQHESVAQRVIGHDFTALGFMDRDRRYTRVRIVTGRGIVIALDPEPGWQLQAARHYSLLRGPVANTQDADGDGFEEVFVEARRNTEACVYVYRVRDVGFVDPVAIDTQLLGRERCPQDVDDIDHDGHAELLTPIELLDFGLDEVPTIRVVLWAERHHFVLHDTHSRAVRYLAQEAAAREVALDQARTSHDVPSVLRLAVELAALAQLSQRSTTDQLARFDGVVSGQQLDASQRAWLDAARARIDQGWGGDDTFVTPAAAFANAKHADATIVISAADEPGPPREADSPPPGAAPARRRTTRSDGSRVRAHAAPRQRTGPKREHTRNTRAEKRAAKPRGQGH